MSRKQLQRGRAQKGKRARTKSAACAKPPRSRWPFVTGLAVVVALAGAANYLLQPPSFGPVVAADSSGFTPRLRTAVDNFVARVEADPSSAAAHGDLGLFYAENGYYREAAVCFEHAEAIDSDNLAWPFHRAMALREAGDTDASTAILTSLANDAGAFAAIFFEYGNALADQGSLDEAYAEFSKAADLATRRPEPLVALADVCNRQSRYEKARDLSRRALDIDPDGTAARYQLGLALRGLGDRDGAKRELQLGLGAKRRALPDPLSGRAAELGISRGSRITRAISLSERGDLPGAERMLRELADEYPKDVAILNNLAAVLIQMKRHDDAMAILNTVVKIDDRPFGPYINLSHCCLQLGRYSDAIDYARSAVSRGTHVSQCYIALGDALLMSQDTDGAIEAYERAHELAPGNVRVLLVLGTLNRKAGRLDQALRYLKDAASMQPDSFVVHANLCTVALDAGDIDIAVRAFAKAEALKHDHPLIDELRKRLQLAQRQ